MSKRREWEFLIQRSLTWLLLSLWWGGLTFYSVFVVPIGTEVLQSSEQQGLVTQEVTKRLNTIGYLVIAAMTWNALRWPPSKRFAPRTWMGTTIVTGISQLALSWLHMRLSHQLIHEIDRENFYNEHRIYLLVVAVQWFAGLISIVYLAWTQKTEPSFRETTG